MRSRWAAAQAETRRIDMGKVYREGDSVLAFLGLEAARLNPCLAGAMPVVLHRTVFMEERKALRGPRLERAELRLNGYQPDGGPVPEFTDVAEDHRVHPSR